MNIDTFLTCLGYYGVSTGASTSLEGAYSLSSGITGVIYNQLYSTGAHFVNGQVYGPTIPLLSVWNNIITNGLFNGSNALNVGRNHTGSFSLVMDIEYSGCNRTPQQKGMVLLSTVASPSEMNSGFYIGITESNRLYFETSGYTRTLDKELGLRDFVYIGLGEKQYVTLGIYGLSNDHVYSEKIALPTGTLDSDHIYIGNFLTNTASDPYTGFVGKINQAFLFSDALTEDDIGVCSNCSLATSFAQENNPYSFVASQITGMYFSGVMEYLITGYTNLTGDVATRDGSTIGVLFPSGLSGLVTTGQVALPMFADVTISGVRNDYVFQYDSTALGAFSSFSLLLDVTLTSGDTIEIYSYANPNANISKRFNGLSWPDESGYIQVVSNGLSETSGVDYIVARNEMSGESLDDILSYDVVIIPTVVTPYSGYWNGGSRLAISGGGFYPSAPQYSENTTSFTGVIHVTGIEGVCVNNPFWPRFGYDLHINGQKLVSGMYYNITTSGASGFVVALSGNSLPPLVIYPTYDGTGGGPIGVADVDDSELTFIPQFSGFQATRTDVTTSANAFGPFTGFGEQVWVNGLRLIENVDYLKISTCSLLSGSMDTPPLDFPLYDSTLGNNGLWNLATPPRISSLVSNPPGEQSIIVTPTLSNPYGYSTSGNCIEVWSSQEVSEGVYSAFVYVGLYPNSAISIGYTGFFDAGNSGSGYAMARYNKDNVIGQFAVSDMAQVQYIA